MILICCSEILLYYWIIGAFPSSPAIVYCFVYFAVLTGLAENVSLRKSTFDDSFVYSISCDYVIGHSLISYVTI